MFEVSHTSDKVTSLCGTYLIDTRRIQWCTGERARGKEFSLCDVASKIRSQAESIFSV